MTSILKAKLTSIFLKTLSGPSIFYMPTAHPLIALPVQMMGSLVMIAAFGLLLHGCVPGLVQLLS